MKRWQVVEIKKGVKHCNDGYIYYVQFHDRRGGQGVFWARYIEKNKKCLIRGLRSSESGIEVSKHVENGGRITVSMKIKEYINECFTTCRNDEDTYCFMVDTTHSLFIMVQENPDYNDGTLEYFIELNDRSTGFDDPCGKYNVCCQIDSLNDFIDVILEYLEDNDICINLEDTI